MHLVGSIIIIYHDARSIQYQSHKFPSLLKVTQSHTLTCYQECTFALHKFCTTNEQSLLNMKGMKGIWKERWTAGHKGIYYQVR